MSKDLKAKAQAVIAVVGGNCGEVANGYLELEQENCRLREYLRLISMNTFDDVLIKQWCDKALREGE